MSAVTSRIQDQRQTAELAADFNDFYQQITLPRITHVGNYRIIREIGEGAFGKVYLAQHVLLHSLVVLKCGKIDDPNIVREIYYHKQLRHRNIVKLFEVVKTETQLWIVLEYCEGNELFYHIYDQRRLDIESTKSIFYQIVEGIRYVHSLNLAHRDLKLENILMADTKKTIVKLTDFGFVREFNPSKRSFLSTVCGTTAYMAPEVLNGVKYSGFAIDIWSMGVILYAMLYGELPFDEDDEIETKIKITTGEPHYTDSVAEEVNSLIKHMLIKDPSKRATLSEIQNSSLLMDMTNAKLSRRNSTQNDNDSLMSINQYHKVNTMPFQTRIEKHLLKKLEKSNIDIQAIQDSRLDGQDNVLTAFYELALTREFEKKKKRHLKKKRYYEAKHQLRKSTNRVKSVLSLSEQSPGSNIPLERILTSLSLNSRQEPSPTTNFRQELSSETKIQLSPEPLTKRLSSLSKQENNELSIMGRTVSFYTDDTRNSITSPSDEIPANSKGKQIIEKLRFWKKLKPNKNEGFRIDNVETVLNPSSIKASSIDESALKIDIPTQPMMSSEMELPATDQFTPTFTKGSPKIEVGSGEDANLNLNHFTNSDETHANTRISSISNDSYGRRPRPESVISQFSLQSQQSHLYNMSEFEYDPIYGSDDELFDDDAYNSSVNTSQQDLHHRSLVVSSKSRRFRRPPNFRSHSDTLILSSSTSATKRRSTLTRFSSNSSSESNAQIKVDEGSLNGAGGSRPNSPRLRLKGKGAKGKSRVSKSSHSPKNSYNGQLLTPAPVQPQNSNRVMDRCYSPPAGRKMGKQNSIVGNSQLFTVLPTNLRRLSASNNFTPSSMKSPAKGLDGEQTLRKFEGVSSINTSGKFELINEEEEE